MTEIKTEITINATVDKIWNILTDFDSYQQWNPFIQKIQGKPQLNQRLVITIKPPEKKKMIFKPVINSMLEKSSFSWVGNLIMPGIFDGQHSFSLKELPNNQVQFIHTECFTGILRKPIFKLLGQSTASGFEQMNQALKKRCEELV